VAQLRAELDDAKKLSVEMAQLRADLKRLGALDVLELERQRDELRREITNQEVELAGQRRIHTEALAQEARAAEALMQERLAKTQAEMLQLNTELVELRSRVVVTAEASILQLDL